MTVSGKAVQKPLTAPSGTEPADVAGRGPRNLLSPSCLSDAASRSSPSRSWVREPWTIDDMAPPDSWSDAKLWAAIGRICPLPQNVNEDRRTT
jgi:hypothetical protein